MGVAVAVGVDPAIAVEVGVGICAGVDVTADVGVAVGVGVGVDVRVAVGVAVGLIDPLAEPLNWTVADDFPLVALLVIGIVAVKLPAIVGANSTVTIDAPRGWSRVVPWPDVIVKNRLPVPLGDPTVTERAAEPVSVMMKDFVFVTGLAERLI